MTKSNFLSQATQTASVLSPHLSKNVFHLPSHNHWSKDMLASVFPPQNSTVSVYSDRRVATVIWCQFIPTYLFFIPPFRMYKVLVAQSCLTLCNPMEFSCQAPQSMEFSGQEYWSGLPFPFPGIFLTQRSNLGLLHCGQIRYHLSHRGRYTSYLN